MGSGDDVNKCNGGFHILILEMTIMSKGERLRNKRSTSFDS